MFPYKKKIYILANKKISENDQILKQVCFYKKSANVLN